MFVPWMWFAILGLVVERIAATQISSRNERWLLEKGGRSSIDKHYLGLLFVQYLSFGAIMVEILFIKQTAMSFHVFFFVCCVIVLCAKWWCIRSAGMFWNAKKITLPRVRLFKQGPYKYVKEPEYLITLFEIAFIPLFFGAYITACVFPLLYMFYFKATQSGGSKVYTNA
ncbi:isoprenylcysteine carboxylmethyltransferase family protein [Oceanobacillus manasiensis]|uniref:isoprenylcysteine carboxylmethyltransferase family protein n=1 Tax=Oceanobacillus manasiensis TaxID=586413 RepID=UPI0005AAA9D1|nr:isoprenylcysteine carboxylmethyltransferase family protein [Oceanobacillus manasiensis]